MTQPPPLSSVSPAQQRPAAGGGDLGARLAAVAQSEPAVLLNWLLFEFDQVASDDDLDDLLDDAVPLWDRALVAPAGQCLEYGLAFGRILAAFRRMAETAYSDPVLFSFADVPGLAKLPEADRLFYDSVLTVFRRLDGESLLGFAEDLESIWRAAERVTIPERNVLLILLGRWRRWLSGPAGLVGDRATLEAWVDADRRPFAAQISLTVTVRNRGARARRVSLHTEGFLLVETGPDEKRQSGFESDLGSMMPGETYEIPAILTPEKRGLHAFKFYCEFADREARDKRVEFENIVEIF